jgi:hypothetical protein
MRSLLVLPLLAAVSLAGCKKEAVVAKDESVESVAKKVEAAGLKPRPGRWEMTMKMNKMDIPNMPPQAKEAMNKQMNVTQTAASCLTQEQVDKPGGAFFGQGNEDCKYDHFAMADGKIDAAMTCAQQGTQLKMTMAGAYTETNYDIAVTSKGEIQKGMPMEIEMAINARRTGECTGNEPK